MDKDLYVDLLESEIRRIRAGANTHYGQSIGWMDEIQDLQLENDRLKKRDNIMLKFVRAAWCKGNVCGNCLFFDDSYPLGKKCIYNRNNIFADISKAAEDVLQELDNL